MSTRTETVEVDARIKALAEKPEWTAEDAVEVIAAWRASGATLAGFARAHGTQAQRIRNWRDRKLGDRGGRKERRPAARKHPARERDALVRPLLPVKVVGDAARASTEAAPSTMEVVLSGGRSVKLGADFDPAALSRLLTTLESLPC